MKNCEPALSGLPGTMTAATEPRVIFGARASAFTALSPPVPYCARLAGSFVSGSPPCTIPYLTTRWKVVPSYAPSDACFMKYAAVFGADSGVRSMTNVPAVVSTTACFGVCAAVRHRPNARQAATTTAAVRALFIGPSSIGSGIRSRQSRVRLDDPRGMPDVMQAGNQRDRQRRPDEQVEQQRVVTEIVEQHRADGGQDVDRRRELAPHRRPERPPPDREVDDRDGEHDDDVAADHHDRQPQRQAIRQAETRHGEHDEGADQQQLVRHRIEPGAERGLLARTPRDEPVERI